MLIIKQLAIFCLLFFGFGKSNFQTQKMVYAINPYVVSTSLNHLNRIATATRSEIVNPKSYHAFHTSLTQIEYNSKEKSLEISIRVFTDDFETGLTKFNNGKKVIITADDKNDALISKYIQQHFAFISPQKQHKNYNFIGKEIEEQATWIYVELPDYQAVSAGYSLQNTILTELFDDQTNLVNFTVLSNKKTFIFNSKKPIFEIAF